MFHSKIPWKSHFFTVKSHETTISLWSKKINWGHALGAMASSVQWRPSLALLTADLGALIPGTKNLTIFWDFLVIFRDFVGFEFRVLL